MTIFNPGPCRLKGDVPISGSKNASLPLIASTLLFEQEVSLKNIPHLLDIGVLLGLLRDLGSSITVEPSALRFHHEQQKRTPLICPQKAAKIRGSVLLLAPLLGRYGEILLPLPGGCNIGKRPINFHLYALEQLGAEFSILPQGIYGCLPDGQFHGGKICFPKPTVTGTENALMAAAIAHGTTCIENAAQDDEVHELIQLLQLSGVNIESHEDVIEVIGMGSLLKAPSEPFSIAADRIEAGTFLAGCGITEGEIFLRFERCPGLEPVLSHLESMGMSLSSCQGGLRASVLQPLKAVSFTTEPHPGFPTDLQAPFLALNCVSKGRSIVTETIWENRFLHAAEFAKMGAQVSADPKHVKIQGVNELHGAEMFAHDLRGSAATLLLTLRAKGPSIIHHAEKHYERGYSFFLEKLNRLGASLKSVPSQTILTRETVIS